MRNLLIIFLLLSSDHMMAQIDQSILVIGRNVGTHTFHDGEQTRIMGFTSSLSADTKIPGPTLIMNSGDSVEIDFWNMSQGAPHTIHLHGLDVDQQNDGVPMLSFEVDHQEHGYYYFKAPHPGTYLYHCHVGSAIHLQAGMYGLLIVRPTDGNSLLNWDGGESYDREFSLLASEIDTVWHNDTVLDHVHDMDMPLYVPTSFKPQYFLINGMSGTQLQSTNANMYVLPNEKVYMRLANIGYYGVRYIFPASLNARTVASDGRPLPAEFELDTIEVLPGERYETFVQIGNDPEYDLIVQHFDLNTQLVAEEQEMNFILSAAGLSELKIPTIYPNPSFGIFFLSESMDFAVFNTDGRMVLRDHSDRIDLGSYSSGVYVLRIGDQSYRLIKN
jgi:FtsP/CotA-like multicopper oxidase with cupredoxin domain